MKKEEGSEEFSIVSAKPKKTEVLKKRKFRKTFLMPLLLIFIILGILSVFAVLLQQTDFSSGTYNQTHYNASVGAVQLNLSFGNGTYTSQIFNTGSNVSLNNMSWNYQRVQCPANMSYINKLNGYCIDKYEASALGCEIVGKNCGNYTHASYCATICVPTDGILGGVNSDTGTTAIAHSRANVAPFVGVSQKQARQMCANAGKHLCTDEQWLAAADLKGQYYNLPTSLSASPYYCVVDSGTYCNYAGNSNYACNTTKYKNGDSGCNSSAGVYDMTGNVWEWTNETVNYVKPCTPATSGYCYWNGTGWGTSGNAKFGNDGVYYLDNSTTRSGYAVLRGGRWADGAGPGPFGAALHNAPSDVHSAIGFRCCSV